MGHRPVLGVLDRQEAIVGRICTLNQHGFSGTESPRLAKGAHRGVFSHPQMEQGLV